MNLGILLKTMPDKIFMELIMSCSAQKTLMALLCIILSGLCFYFSLGFNGIWPLLWIAPTFPILYSYHYDAKSSFVVAFLSLSLGSLSLLTYAHTILPTRIFITPIIFPAIFFALILIINAQVVKHLRHWLTILLLPSLWVSYEFVVSHIAPSGPFNSFAFTQVKFLLFAQLASVTGILGMTFMLLLVSSGISYALYFKQSTQYRVYAIALPLLLLSLCLVFGYIRLNTTQQQATSVKIGLAFIDAPIQVSGPASFTLMQRYIKLIESLAKQGASIIVLPERIIGVNPEAQNQLINLLKPITKQNHITLVLGLARFGQPDRNATIVIDSQGNVGTYNKQHLVPGLESRFAPGKQLLILKQSPSFGVAICKDMDFTYPALNYGKQHVELLLVPASDFDVDGWLHAKVAILQGIANGYAVARAAAYGLLTITNQYGQIVAMKNDVNQDETMLIGELSLSPVKTLYSLWGNWFGWLSLIIVMFFAIIVILKRKALNNETTFRNCRATH